MTRFILSVFGAIFSWVTIGLFMGAIALGAVLYFYSRDLPDHQQLANYRPATISRIYSVEGRIIDEFAQERRLYAPIGDVPEIVKGAFISAEDKNFYQHQGYDLRGIAAAAVEAVQTRGERVRGASTIPQQVVKNFLLSSDRSAERKLKELILSVRLEHTLSKDQILELYLNEIFLGQNSYGVTAAAQTYFNKTLSQLTPAEAAYLAALPQAPSNFHPVRDRERAVARRDFVLREMYENGYITKEQHDEAVATPLRTVQGGEIEGFRDQLPPRDYFTDEIRRQLSRDFGEDEFMGGGYTVRATADPEMQAIAARAMRRALEAYDRSQGQWRGTGKTLDAAALDDEAAWRAALAATEVPRDVPGWYPAVVLSLGESSARIGIEGIDEDADGHWIPAESVRWIRGARGAGDVLSVGDVVHVSRDEGAEGWSLHQIPEVQGGFMAMDVNTGRVIAMQGGFSYQDSVFNRVTQATRQPGSAFKPFVYAAALDNGFTPASIIIDAPIAIDTGAGIWRPRNSSNKFYGPTPLRTGIEQSRNLMTVRLAQEVGMDVVATYAERFGVYDNMGQFLANSLGSEETTLYRMVAAYAMFANGGERVEPTLVDRVQDRWGTTVYRHDQRTCEDCQVASLQPGYGPLITSERQRVMNAVTAYQITSMMEGVVQRGTAASRVNLPVPTAGKTGTTNDARDVWFVGFTSNIAAGCYMGFDQPRSLGPSAYGGTLCAPVFQEFMEEAVARYGGGPFEVPPGGRFIKIDRFTGMPLPPDASGPSVVAEYFRDGGEPTFGLTYDGGFAMASNLPLYTPEELGNGSDRTITTSSGDTVVVPDQADFGTLSSGGLY
ncbi:penicillin-binding protein 1A [Palleronia sp. KMU-117]|uniref:penicillin-binding protein 1A n=1 Tax=Palleronia sp. KMU-117 TaxID=3434108 RepID=UPI003D71992E